MPQGIGHGTGGATALAVDAAEMTITRMWRGWTNRQAADDYERFLLGELFPSMRSSEGFLGADVLRRSHGDEIAFVTLTRFRLLDDVRAFAGDSFDAPVIEPRAAELLARYDTRAVHFETSTFEV
jgi:antibiotic biosynthesis monooxygenase (ABM) superfamily enzyme